MAKKGRPKNREEVVTPTLETLARLKPDPLRAMLVLGIIDTAGERAADEIREIYMAVCSCVMRRKGRYGQEFGMPSGTPVELPDAISEAHARTYIPWVKETNPKTVDATLTLVVDREGIGRRWPEVAVALSDYARRMVSTRRGT